MASGDTDQFREAYQALLDAAGPIAGLQSAWLAENATSMLLGGVYSYATGGERRAVMGHFIDGFVKFLVRRRSPEAQAVLAGLAGIAPGEGAARAAKAIERIENRDAIVSRWATAAGKVRCTGAWQVTDVYGDQSHYIVTYAYEDPETGGPDHSIGILVDHNRRVVADVVTGAPAEQVVDGWRQTSHHSEGKIGLAQLEPTLVRAYVEGHLLRTETLPEPPGGQQYLDHWAMAVARLGLLPDSAGSGPPLLSAGARDGVVKAFLRSPEGEQLTSGGCRPPVAERAARAAVDYAVEANSGDPLRWSPTAVELFLLEWMPTRKDIPAEVGSWAPEVMDAFVAYAGNAKGLPDDAVAGTRASLAAISQRYAGKMAGGEGEGESFDALIDRMIADGVDPADEEAARAWLTKHLEQG